MSQFKDACLIKVLSCIGALAFILCSCKPGVPTDVLGVTEMENVLYDVHMAQTLASQSSVDSVDYYRRLYMQAVYDKYHIDADDFYSSLSWYERHTDRLVDIYDRLSKRYGEGSAYGEYPMTSASNSGDSLDVWRGAPFVLLNSNGETHFVSLLKADTLLAADDELVWQFSVDWHYHEGSREGVALLVVHYQGDSIAVAQSALYSSGPNSIRTRIGNRQVESVECMLYQDSPQSSRPRLLVMAAPHLWRIRMKVEKTEIDQRDLKVLKRDSLNKNAASEQHHLRDSLLRDDSLRERRPHFR